MILTPTEPKFEISHGRHNQDKSFGVHLFQILSSLSVPLAMGHLGAPEQSSDLLGPIEAFCP